MENDTQTTNKMKSKIAITLTAIYVVIATGLDIYSITCGSDMFCGLIAVFTAIPWIFPPFNNLVAFLNHDSFLSLIFLQILNAVIIYFIGLGISKIIKKIKN